jgi:hypothetical protein
VRFAFYAIFFLHLLEINERGHPIRQKRVFFRNVEKMCTSHKSKAVREKMYILDKWRINSQILIIYFQKRGDQSKQKRRKHYQCPKRLLRQLWH